MWCYGVATMTVRMQVSIDSELHRRARERAAGEGVSFAEYVRRLLADDLARTSPQGDVTAIFNLVTEGEETDVANDKDDLIGEAAAAEHSSGLSGR
jgi:hypothetical protein